MIIKYEYHQSRGYNYHLIEFYDEYNLVTGLVGELIYTAENTRFNELIKQIKIPKIQLDALKILGSNKKSSIVLEYGSIIQI